MRVTMVEARMGPERLLEAGKSYTLDADFANALVEQGYATKGGRRRAAEADEPEADTEADIEETHQAGDPAAEQQEG